MSYMTPELETMELFFWWLDNGIFDCVSSSKFAGFYTNWETGKWNIRHCL